MAPSPWADAPPGAHAFLNGFGSTWANSSHLLLPHDFSWNACASNPPVLKHSWGVPQEGKDRQDRQESFVQGQFG